jgi:hypothetical protein
MYMNGQLIMETSPSFRERILRGAALSEITQNTNPGHKYTVDFGWFKQEIKGDYIYGSCKKDYDVPFAKQRRSDWYCFPVAF